MTLADATCLSIPAAAARHLGLDAAAGAGPLPHPADAEATSRLLGPVAEVTGSAVLSYLDPAHLDPTHLNSGQPPARPGAVAAADAATAAHLAVACPASERDESGILQITSAPWVWREPGHAPGQPAVAAACGYQVWDGGLAQFSVLVHPDRRGRGLGRAVAAAAVRAAVAEGLIPQWRARSSLLASRRIAETLGFTELGWQAVYRLRRPPRDGQGNPVRSW